MSVQNDCCLSRDRVFWVEIHRVLFIVSAYCMLSMALHCLLLAFAFRILNFNFGILMDNNDKEFPDPAITDCTLISHHLEHRRSTMEPPQTPKRPRAETQTQTSPKHSRARVDRPELEFTLFDESEDTAIIPISALDDQLSDTDASNSGDTLPPLTPSPARSELGSDEVLDGKPSLV